MDIFSIAQLQQYSGVKAHTIRIWEQRYNALKPKRSDGNVRYYDGSQLRRLLNIVSLTEMNFKVSEVGALSDDKIFRLLESRLKDPVSADDPYSSYTAQLIASAMSYDEMYFEKIFSACVLRVGIKDTFVKIIYPMLVRVGLMWAGDAIPSSQEHFITNLLRQKLFSAIDALPPAKTTSRNVWVLYLPENEFHEIGLLLANYLIRLSGKKIIYLGANVNFESLKDTVEQVNPSHLFFFLTHYDMPESTQEYVNKVAKNFTKQKIYLTGNAKLIEKLKLKKEITWVRSPDELALTFSK